MTECYLMPSGPVKFIVQGCLFCICFGVLAYKCHIDTSGRSTVRFIFDSSKNVSGAAWMHVANMLCATLLGRTNPGGDECQWYFIEIMIDTTVGVYVEYKLLETLRTWLRDWGCEKWAEDVEAPCVEEEAQDVEASGRGTTCDGKSVPLLAQDALGANAGSITSVAFERFQREFTTLLTTLNAKRYLVQLLAWLFVVTVMKFIMVILMLALSPQLEALSAFVLQPLTNPTCKLIVVMILTPSIMNALQFWLQDNIFVDVDRWHKKEQKVKEEARLAGCDDLDDMGPPFSEITKEWEQLKSKEWEQLKSKADTSQQLTFEKVEDTFEKVMKFSKQLDSTHKVLEAELERRKDASFRKVCHAHNAHNAPTLRFTVKHKTTRNQQMAMCTSETLHTLGKTGSPVILGCSRFPVWESSEVSQCESVVLYYKFGIADKKTKEVRWEDEYRVLHPGEHPKTAEFNKT